MLILNPPLFLTRKYTGHHGMYAQVDPETCDEFDTLVQIVTLDMPCPVTVKDLTDRPHLTLMVSDRGVPRVSLLGMQEYLSQPHRAAVDKVEYWEGDDNLGYLVLILRSADLYDVHEMLVKLGAVHKYRTYEPHVTLCSEIGRLTSEIKDWLVDINAFLDTVDLNLTFGRMEFQDRLR